MEEQLISVFKTLNDDSLCSARLVCQYWREIIDSRKFWWLRIIHNELSKCQLIKSNPTWKRNAWKKLIKKVLKKGTFQAIIQLGVLIQSNQKYAIHLLHYCASEGLTDLLNILLPYIKSKDLILDFGWQPLPLYFALSYAARDGQLETLKTFVKHFGEDIFVQFQKQYPDGRLSPLYYALRNEDSEMVDYLLGLPMPKKVLDDVKQQGLLAE